MLESVPPTHRGEIMTYSWKKWVSKRNSGIKLQRYFWSSFLEAIPSLKLSFNPHQMAVPESWAGKYWRAATRQNTEAVFSDRTSWAELGAQSRLKQLDCKDFLSYAKWRIWHTILQSPILLYSFGGLGSNLGSIFGFNIGFNIGCNIGLHIGLNIGLNIWVQYWV